MPAPMKRLLCLFAILLVLGCRIDEEVVVFPDGSGKYTLSLGIKKRSPDESNRWPELALLDEQWSGIVAWAEPKLREDEKWRYAVLTGYFEDINRLRTWKKRYGPGVPCAREALHGRSLAS